eukprot:2804756-Rhodomonas_salina.2
MEDERVEDDEARAVLQLQPRAQESPRPRDKPRPRCALVSRRHDGDMRASTRTLPFKCALSFVRRHRVTCLVQGVLDIYPGGLHHAVSASSYSRLSLPESSHWQPACPPGLGLPGPGAPGSAQRLPSCSPPTAPPLPRSCGKLAGGGSHAAVVKHGRRVLVAAGSG